MSAKYELKKSANAQFFFNLKAANGEVILSSEQYEEKSSATNGIESVRKNAPDDARYERKTSKDGKPFFVLTAANGQTIGKSEMYESTSSMENGIVSVKKNAPDARVEDLT
ncbi:MAG: YegP family protein [Thermoanaerobaculia bacterium]